MYKILSLCAVVALISLFISIYVSDYTIELILDQVHSKKRLYQSGLSPNSKQKLIATHSLPVHYLKLHGYLQINHDNKFITKQGIVVDPSISRVNSAVIIIHGASTTPAYMNHWVDKIRNMKSNNHDIYIPLLDCHGQNVRNLTKISNRLVRQKLTDDIKYIASLGYDKIYCIGHSLGGAHLINIALSDLSKTLQSRITFISYCPAIYLKISFLKKLALKVIHMFKKYLVFKFELSYINRKNLDMSCDCPFYPFTTQLMIELDDLERSIESKLCNNKSYVENLYIILTETDGACDYTKAKSIERYCNIRILPRGGHNPELHQDLIIQKGFYELVEDIFSQ